METIVYLIVPAMVASFLEPLRGMGAQKHYTETNNRVMPVV